jgi:hypothetical protein
MRIFQPDALYFWNTDKTNANPIVALHRKAEGSVDRNGIARKNSRKLLLSFRENELQTIVLVSQKRILVTKQ